MITGREIGYSGLDGTHRFVVVDPSNPKTSASHGTNAPCAVTYLLLPVTNAAGRMNSLKSGRQSCAQLSRWRREDGTPLPAYARVILLESGSNGPHRPCSTYHDTDLKPQPQAYFVAPGWSASHRQPLASKGPSSCSRHDRLVTPGPLPKFVPAFRSDPIVPSMILAAQIELLHEQRISSTAWAILSTAPGNWDSLAAGLKIRLPRGGEYSRAVDRFLPKRGPACQGRKLPGSARPARGRADDCTPEHLCQLAKPVKRFS